MAKHRPTPDLHRTSNAAARCPDEMPPHIRRVALVLQGGGALGPFQAGAYEGLAQAGYLPDWIAGTSIGAIHAAILAGNPPERRLERLREFWDRVAWPEYIAAPAWNSPFRGWYNCWHAAVAMLAGQPSFFRPRWPSPWFALPGTQAALSFYEVDGLKETLRELVDFELLNGGDVRLSLGAVNVRSGKSVYFDSARQPIRLEHILASTALPPGLPPVEVDGELYWDGGIVSNTPLEVVLDDNPRASTLCFMVDLFDARGEPPMDIEEVLQRHKDITYASRSDSHIESYRALHNLRRIINTLYRRLPPEDQADPELKALAAWGCTTTMNIIHMVYRGTPAEAAFKDYEFSRASIRDHWAAGLRDARRAVAEQRWLAPPPPHLGVVVEEVVAGPTATTLSESRADPATVTATVA